VCGPQKTCWLPLPNVRQERDALPPGVWKIMAVAVLGSFLAQLDATVVNVSLSSLALELHSTLAAVQWVTSGYLLALALMLPLNGWLVDRIGAKSLYLWCFATFTLSSAMCGLAWSTASLVGFRVLQGMSGGLLAPMAQLVVARVAGRHMARLFGYAALPILLGPVVGPVLAGAILVHVSWRWLFLINVPVGALAILMAWRFLPADGPAPHRRDLDLRGLLLLSPALVLFLYAVDHVRTPSGWALLALSVLLLAMFLRHARRLEDRALIDLRLMRGTFRVSAMVQFLSNGISFAGQMLLPYFLVRACGLSPARAGWMMAPLGLGMMCVYPWMGAATDRWGVRRVSAAGAAVALAATAPLVWLAARGLRIAPLEVALFVRGLGMSAVGVPSISAAYAAVETKRLPMATTALNIVQRIGGPTWTTLVATFLAWRLQTDSMSAGGRAGGPFAAAFTLLLLLHGAQLLATLRLPWSVHRPEAKVDPSAE